MPSFSSSFTKLASPNRAVGLVKCWRLHSPASEFISGLEIRQRRVLVLFCHGRHHSGKPIELQNTTANGQLKVPA